MSQNAYYQPTDMQELQQALQLLPAHGQVVAGGTDFLAMRNHKPWQADILSLSALRELRQIEQEGEALAIGATCTHTQVAADARVRRYFPALSKACGDIGSVQIRNRGTIGGNLVNASPAGDGIPCLYLFGAEAELFAADGACRRLPVAEFLLGPGQTALAEGEILRRLILPLPSTDRQNGYWKLGTRSKVTISQIILAASWQKDGQGRIKDIMLYIGSIAPTPLLIAEAPALFCGNQPGEAVRRELTDLLSDLISRVTPPHYDRDYKRLAIKGLVHDMCDAIANA